MENRAHAIVAGVFAIALGLAVLAALFWFGGKKEQTSEYLVVTRQNVTGLNPQAQVRYRGIRVGKVTDIRLDHDDLRNILITIEVDAAVPVTRGTSAKLGYQGVTGLAHILLEDSGRNTLALTRGEDGKPPRINMAPSLFDQLSESGADALREARLFLNSANRVMDDDNRQRIAGILANLETTTAHLNKLLSDERALKLGSAIARVDRAAESADQFFRDVKQVLPRVNSAMDKVDGLMSAQTPQGLGTTVVRVNELIRDLNATSRQLNRALRVVEESPQSLLFGPPAPQPGPGEPGFAAPVTEGKKP